MSDHPKHQDLVGLVCGDLPDQQAEQVAQHLEQCTQCEDTVLELETTPDEVVQTLRGPVVEDSFEQESECRRLLQLLEASARDASPAEASRAADETAADLGTIRDYQLLARLGQGGMGTVYKALHTQLEKIVALKVLPPERMKDDHAVKRFRQEMRAVGRLEHVNIIRAMDAGQHDGKHYLVMEHVDGMDLAELVHRLGPLPVADACELVRQAAAGLQHAHEHNLVHRDIKPSNLMLTTSGSIEGAVATGSSAAHHPPHSSRVKILDLGLARLHNGDRVDLTSIGQMMGTIDYMAPEQTGDSHEVDNRADIYSLGGTLYKLLCGRAPYDDPKYNTAIKKLNAMATIPIPPIGQRRAEVPEALAAIVNKMLAKEPSKRFATAQEVAEALAPFAEGADLAALSARYRQASQQWQTDDESSRKSTEKHLSCSMTETKSEAEKEHEQLDGTGLQFVTEEQETRSEEAAAAPVASEAFGLATSPPVSAEDERPAELPQSQSQPQAAGRGRNRGTKIVAILLGLAGLFAAGMVITLATDKGEIRITAYDPEVEVTIKRNGQPVDGFQVKQRPDGTSYFSGDYEIVIVGGKPDGVEIKNDRFQLTRNKEVLVEIVRVSPIPPEDSVVSADRRAADWALGIGGTINIAIAGETENREITSGDALPTAEFTLVQINLANNERVDDNGMKNLQGSRVKVLEIGGTSVTDAGLASLQKTRELTQLTIHSTSVTDAGLQHLAGLSELRYLGLPRTEGINGEGLKHLTACENLVMLTLHHQDVTSVIAENAKELPQLTCLALIGSGPSDAPQRLGELTQLKGIFFDQRIKVSPATIEALKTELPGCRIQSTAGPSTAAQEFAAALRGKKPSTKMDVPKVAALKRVPSITEASQQQEPWPLGPDKDVLQGLVPRPAVLPGIRRWQVETRVPRSTITCVDWSPDDTLIACGTLTGEVRVYDTRSWEPVGLFLGKGSVHCVAWHPDGKRLASVGKSVRVWSLEGQPVQVFPSFGSGPNGVTWNPDGTLLATGSSQGVRIWDVDGTPQKEWETVGDFGLNGIGFAWSPGIGFAWSPDGQWLAAERWVDGESNIRLWTPDGTPGPELTGHTNDVVTLAWSPDSQWLASGALDGEVRLWKPDGTEGPVLEAADRVQSVSWSPDSQRLVALSGNNIQTRQIWSVDGELESEEKHNLDWGYAVAWSHDGTRIAATGTNSIHIYGVGGTEDEHLRGIEHGGVQKLAWSPDGNVLATEVEPLRLWTRDGEQIGVLDEFETQGCFAWMPDSPQLLACRRKTLQLLSADGTLLRMFCKMDDKPTGVAWSPDGKRAAVRTRDGGKVHIYSAAGVLEQTLVGRPESRSSQGSLSWHPAGKLLASASFHAGEILLWRVDDDVEPFLTVDVDQVLSLAWSPNGEQLAASGSGGVRLFQPDGTPHLNLKVGGNALAWSPDGKRLASGRASGFVSIWSSEGKRQQMLRGHQQNIVSLDWSPDGTQLSSGGITGTIWTWNPDTGDSEWTTIPLNDSDYATFNGSGQILYGDPDVVEEQFVYVVERESGEQQVLKPSEFAKRIGRPARMAKSATKPVVDSADVQPPPARAPTSGQTEKN